MYYLIQQKPFNIQEHLITPKHLSKPKHINKQMHVYIHTGTFSRFSLLPKNGSKTSILKRALKPNFFQGTVQVKSKRKG